jgi:TolB-like protein/tRNA A-37 threonylcarbamoyl transferase component Bud32/Flp pilus assembly protein TadD
VASLESTEERLKAALADRYLIDCEIGSGGMATVYLAQDLKHARQVAIKVLRSELAAGLGSERFVREIEISANLTHPHILPLFDSGEADGFLYYVMPYVEGESLQDRLGREGKIPAEEAIRLTDQIASALAYAHERGVIHRDIKPANILLTGDRAVVADFGIARAVEVAGTEGLTGTGLAVGTPAYMSPEQAWGGEAVDARTDIYALGCVVYEMITGVLPFEGTGPQALLAKQMMDRGPSLRKSDPAIPVFLDRAVSRALATDANERFESATVFAEALTTGTIVRRVRSRGRRKRVLSGVTAVVLVLTGWGIAKVMGGPSMDRLAVLPLIDLTNNPDQEYLAAGVHEALIAELGQLGLSMISRATMARYRDTDKPIREIARELGVDGVIEGSVFWGGDSLEIVTRLYDQNEQELWTGSFDGVLPNIVALYRGFARAIAGQVRLSLRPGDEARLAEAPPVNPAVYEAYLRGMHILNNAVMPADFDEAINYFNQAVGQNPANALAWAGLAGCYVILGHGLSPDPEVWPLARAAAERAIRLDSMSAEGWAALANFKAYSERDWEGAEEAFRKADELNPSLAWNHYHYAWYLAMFGRVEEAVAEHIRAKELDPLTPLHTVLLPGMYWFSGNNERALAEARTTLEQYPQVPYAHFVVGESAVRLGLYDEAIAAHEEMVRLFQPFISHLGHTYARAGRTQDALRIVQELEALPPSPWNAKGLALIHAALGNPEDALRWLGFEPAHAWVAWMTTSWYPDFDTYRDDPRFQTLLRRMHLQLGPGDRWPVPLPIVHPGLPSATGVASPDSSP